MQLIVQLEALTAMMQRHCAGAAANISRAQTLNGFCLVIHVYCMGVGVGHIQCELALLSQTLNPVNALGVCMLALMQLWLQGGDLLDWTNRDGGIQEESFIQRIEALSTMGYSVLLSNYRRYFSLASYLSTFSKESIVISMGIPSVRVSQVFQQRWTSL